MIDKVIKVLKNNYYVPSILLTNYRKLGITEKELVFLIYLINSHQTVFNPSLFADELEFELTEIMGMTEVLTDKNLIKIQMKKEDNKCFEVINLDSLYNRLSFLVINEEKEEKENSNLFDILEKEFGRTLSPMEYEIINAWKDNYSDELIIAALKEAIYNNVTNLRYIDKILTEWHKKGFKNPNDIKSEASKFSKKDNNEKLFEYDWLNNEE